MKTTPADMWFSRCVRERAGWTCERCHKQYTPPTQALHCSHYIGRGNWAVRFEPLNALALCYGCHQLMGSARGSHDELYERIFGKAAAEIVEEKAKDATLAKQYRRTKGIGEIAEHYKAEYERMMALRAEGVTGRLEFVSYL